MILPPRLPFSTTMTAEPTKAGCQSRPAGTCVVVKAVLTLCKCQERSTWRGESGRGPCRCSGTGRASSEGKWHCWSSCLAALEHLQRVGTVRAEVWSPSVIFFFHLSNGTFLCNNLFLLFLVVLPCISIFAFELSHYIPLSLLKPFSSMHTYTYELSGN